MQSYSPPHSTEEELSLRLAVWSRSLSARTKTQASDCTDPTPNSALAPLGELTSLIILGLQEQTQHTQSLPAWKLQSGGECSGGISEHMRSAYSHSVVYMTILKGKGMIIPIGHSEAGLREVK